MRELDVTSILVAAGIGAVVLWLVGKKYGFDAGPSLVAGLIVGASVQIGVRATGVS